MMQVFDMSIRRGRQDCATGDAKRFVVRPHASKGEWLPVGQGDAVWIFAAVLALRPFVVAICRYQTPAGFKGISK